MMQSANADWISKRVAVNAGTNASPNTRGGTIRRHRGQDLHLRLIRNTIAQCWILTNLANQLPMQINKSWKTYIH